MLVIAGSAQAVPPGDALQARYTMLAGAYMRGDLDAARAAVLPDTGFVDIKGGAQPVEIALQALEPGIVRSSAVTYTMQGVRVPVAGVHDRLSTVGIMRRKASEHSLECVYPCREACPVAC